MITKTLPQWNARLRHSQLYTVRQRLYSVAIRLGSHVRQAMPTFNTRCTLVFLPDGDCGILVVFASFVPRFAEVVGMDPEGKVALITGGGTGIGRATALLLAQHGADIAVNFSRSETEAQNTVMDIEKLGRRAIKIRADVADNSAVTAMVETVLRQLGRLDILVNSAGWTRFADFKDLDALDDEAWDRTMAVNVKGPFYCTRAAVAPMRKVGAGVVINLSSIAGLIARGSSIPYAASKSALNIVTRALARALAPEIRVNAVAPGVADTRWVKGQEAFVRGAQLQTPMRRIATPQEIAQSILSLIADNDFVTGQILNVDGGMTA